MKMFFTIALLGFVFVAAAADAWKLPTDQPKFRPGPGAEVATANCLLCHSADYVSTQPSLPRAAWLATVTKMREKYGAPLPTNQVERVVDYLANSYGKKTR
jgi:mono/diheme cytochrome c family protein